MNSNDTKGLMPFIKLFFAVFFWGNSFIATKIVVLEIAPSLLIGLRAFIGGVVLLGILSFERKLKLLPYKDLLYFAFLGFIGVALHQWLQSTAMLYTTASSAGWLIATTPVFMSILGFFWLKEKLKIWQVSGVIIAASGVLVVTTRGSISSFDFSAFGNYGDLLMLVSALNWAIFSILSRRKLKENDPVLMIFYVTIFGLFFNTIQVIYEGSWQGITNLSDKGWLSLLFLGIFCTAAAQAFWYDGLKKLQAYQAGIFLYIQPIFTVITAVWIGLENFSLAVLLGGAVILFGVWLVNKKEFRKTK